LQVDVRHAQVVNVSRDPSRPWEWRERSAEIFRFPVGTFIVVIGVDQASGVVRAYRLEVPK
jgi:hypothetical protein